MYRGASPCSKTISSLDASQRYRNIVRSKTVPQHGVLSFYSQKRLLSWRFTYTTFFYPNPIFKDHGYITNGMMRIIGYSGIATLYNGWYKSKSLNWSHTFVLYVWQQRIDLPEIPDKITRKLYILDEVYFCIVWGLN